MFYGNVNTVCNLLHRQIAKKDIPVVCRNDNCQHFILVTGLQNYVLHGLLFFIEFQICLVFQTCAALCLYLQTTFKHCIMIPSLVKLFPTDKKDYKIIIIIMHIIINIINHISLLTPKAHVTLQPRCILCMHSACHLKRLHKSSLGRSKLPLGQLVTRCIISPIFINTEPAVQQLGPFRI